MQINPFGFPLGAGMQSASAIGGTGLGFADALGLAIEGGTAPQLTALKASATPPAHFGPKLAQTLLEQAQLAGQVLPKAAPGILPGLQQPTSLSELMATAAKLPGADQVPMAATATATIATPVLVTVDATPAATPEIPAAAAPLAAEPEIVPAPAVPVAPAAETTSPAPAPLAAAPEIAAPLAPVSAAPVQGDAEPQPAADAVPDAPAVTAPAETAEIAEIVPSKPQKGPRAPAAAAETDPAPSNDAQPAIPAEMLAINAMPQPIAPQQSAPQQSMPREPSNAQSGSAGSKIGKAAAQTAQAQAQDAVQSAPDTGTADFARAVVAKAESAGSDANPDGQPQPEAIFAAAAKTDAAAPILPQHAHSPNAVDTARATAPAAPAAPAEPVIEGRTGHLGHSLGVEIARKVELGEETLRIRLNPIELGRIEVTLAFDDKGSLQATVRTESAQAMDLLRQDAPDLARTLDQAGVRTDAQSFRFENRGGDGGGQQAQQQNQHSNRGQFASSDDDSGTAEPIYRPIRSDGQVDLLA